MRAEPKRPSLFAQIDKLFFVFTQKTFLEG